MSAESESKDNSQKETTEQPHLIVGIGASAGGLEACKRFLTEVPAESGMAFIVIMHLAPKHESRVAEILKTTTAMEVAQVSGNPVIEPNHVYVIAPGSSLNVRQLVLHSTEVTEPLGPPKPIDTLFSSLAEQHGERAVGIVLSGADSDGSAGIQSIRAAGGLCIAQDPQTAEYDTMPQAAIDTGMVDHVLPPDQMAKVLLAYEEKPHLLAIPQAEVREDEKPSEEFAAILQLLGKEYGLDFRLYKKGTLQRRTERRIDLLHISGWQAYLDHLRKEPKELAALYRDLLIGVTHFFRDQEVWDYLEKEGLPQLIAKRNDDSPFRIWVAGCATGEEAYSVAMLLIEQLGRAGHPPKLQVYGTDINRDAVAFARNGLYPSTIAGDVSPERLQRFFTQEGGDFRIKQEVRDSVTFAVHNLLADPPFSKLDVVSCRNLLIYLEPNAQDRLLELFHFALRVGGMLILGNSETTSRQADLFEALSKKHRIFSWRRSSKSAAERSRTARSNRRAAERGRGLV
jgi:two-component system CheB/CheR fusion protein